MRVQYSEDKKTTYKSFDFIIKNSTYTVLVVTGNSNCISVIKKIHIPSLGKEFISFDEAINYYKNPSIKIQLLLIESFLKNN